MQVLLIRVIFRARRIVDYIYTHGYCPPARYVPYPRQHSTMFLTLLVYFAPYYSSFIAIAGEKKPCCSVCGMRLLDTGLRIFDIRGFSYILRFRIMSRGII